MAQDAGTQGGQQDPQGGGAGSGAQGNQNPEGGTPPVAGAIPNSWGDFIGGQSEEIRKLYTDETSGLKSALDKERTKRSELSDEIRTIKESAEGVVKERLGELEVKLEEGDRRSAFYEDASAEGVNDLKLAYLAAVDGEHFDRKGRPDFDKLRESHPQLFKTPTPAGHAGAGTQSSTPATGDPMDVVIRGAAGR